MLVTDQVGNFQQHFAKIRGSFLAENKKGSHPIIMSDGVRESSDDWIPMAICAKRRT